jgi:lipid-A-disaccharide synthase
MPTACGSGWPSAACRRFDEWEKSLLHLVAIVNGPGEVAGWMLPVAERLKAQSPDSRVTAVVTPCQFASGRERDVIAGCPAVDEALTMGGFVRRYWRTRAHEAAPRNSRMLVVHFGGDPIYAAAASALLGVPAWRHGTSCRGLMRADRYLVPDERTRAKFERCGIRADRIDVVGQVVVDSVPLQARTAARDSGTRAGHERVVLMPGSRRFELDFMLPFYVPVLDELRRRRPGAVCVLPIAPFVSLEQFYNVAASAGYRIERRDDGAWLVTPGGTACRIAGGDPYTPLLAADLVVTLPGTNTLQLAAVGVPYIVLLPLNRGENIPLEGLAGWLLPSVRPFGLFRRYLTWWINRGIDYVALPNILAGEPVVPELRGVLEPGAVAATVVELLDDPARCAEMSVRLREIAGPPGAAGRAATALLEG